MCVYIVSTEKNLYTRKDLFLIKITNIPPKKQKQINEKYKKKKHKIIALKTFWIT